MLIRGTRFFRRVITYSRQKVPTVFPLDPENPRPTVHIDVTRIAENDIRTGVQRVVRQICRHWYQASERQVDLNFIRVSDSGQIVTAFAWATALLGVDNELGVEGPVHFREGDTLFLLDLVLPPRGINRRVMSSLRQEGLRVVSMVYDLLPITHPQYFPISSQLLFRWWAKKALDVDHIITISQTMKTDIEHHQKRLTRGRVPPTPRVSVIPLSGEPEPDDAPEDEKVVEAARQVNGKLFICIGTVEPRKGYDEVIEAFEELWEEGQDYHLWIFGKPGWKTHKLQRKMSSLSRTNRRFKWVQDASDETVRASLRSAEGMIINSYAEGLGLPILEAKHAEVRILARGIPVFEEVLASVSAQGATVGAKVGIAEQLRLKPDYRLSEKRSSKQARQSWNKTALTCEYLILEMRR
jgi:glycosyltransferase involved in cell wall biosynthesis